MILYEYIGILSIIAYIGVLVSIWSMGEYDLQAIWHMEFETVMCVLCYLMNWIAYCLYRRKISNVHIEIYKLTAVSKFEDELLCYAHMYVSYDTLSPIFYLQREPHTKDNIDDHWRRWILFIGPVFGSR